MNALQRYVAKQTLIEKLAEVTKKVPKNPATQSLGAKLVTDAPVRRLAGDILSLPLKMGRRAARKEQARRKAATDPAAVARAHKISPKAYHSGTTYLKRYYKPDGSLKDGWSRLTKNPLYPAIGPRHITHRAKKGPWNK